MGPESIVINGWIVITYQHPIKWTYKFGKLYKHPINGLEKNPGTGYFGVISPRKKWKPTNPWELATNSQASPEECPHSQENSGHAEVQTCEFMENFEVCDSLMDLFEGFVIR